MNSPQRRSYADLFRTLWPCMVPHWRGLLSASALLTAGTVLFQMGPLLLRRAIDVDLAGRDLRGLYATAALYAFVQLGLLGSTWAQRVLLETIGQNVMTTLKRTLFNRTLLLSMGWFDRTSPGDLVARVENDADALRQLLTYSVITIVGDLLKLVVGLMLLLSVDVRLSVVVLAVLVAITLLTLAANRFAVPVFREARERNGEVMSFLSERLHAVEVLQAYRQTDAACADMAGLNDEKAAADFRGYGVWNVYFNALQAAEIGGLTLCLGLGGAQVLQGALSIGTVLMFTQFLRRFFEPVCRLSEQLNVVQKALACVERVQTLLDTEPTVRDPAHPRAWARLETGVTFHDVHFSYGDEPILDGVSFTVPRGQTWAVVGPTGSGKSTLLALIARLYDPTRGKVSVDGIDVRELRQADLRSRMAMVLQDTVIFPGTVLENLSPDGIGTDRRPVEKAAQATGAHDLIMRMSQGYDTVLLERGTNLSAGERQLLDVTRALARDPDILVLDEATASVDPETERLLERARLRLLENRTALVVAHRLTTVLHADHILVMDRGRVVEQGRHEELIAMHGLYDRLWRSQSHPVAAPEGVPA